MFPAKPHACGGVSENEMITTPHKHQTSKMNHFPKILFCCTPHRRKKPLLAREVPAEQLQGKPSEFCGSLVPLKQNCRRVPHKSFHRSSMFCYYCRWKNPLQFSKFSEKIPLFGLSNEIQIGISYGIQPQKGLRVQAIISWKMSFVPTKNSMGSQSPQIDVSNSKAWIVRCTIKLRADCEVCKVKKQMGKTW